MHTRPRVLPHEWLETTQTHIDIGSASIPSLPFRNMIALTAAVAASTDINAEKLASSARKLSSNGLSTDAKRWVNAIPSPSDDGRDGRTECAVWS